MLAPAGLILALAAVVGSVRNLIVHFEHVVEAARICLLAGLGSGSGRRGLAGTEVADVRVLLVELRLELGNAGHRCLLRLASLFLFAHKDGKQVNY